jgi:hypothetical protein
VERSLHLLRTPVVPHRPGFEQRPVSRWRWRGGHQRGAGDEERLPHALSTLGVACVVLEMRRDACMDGESSACSRQAWREETIMETLAMGNGHGARCRS